MINVLFAALIGGFALGQAAPNLQYFTQVRAGAAGSPPPSHSEQLAAADAAGSLRVAAQVRAAACSQLLVLLFLKGKAAGGRIFEVMQRQPAIDTNADGAPGCMAAAQRCCLWRGTAASMA